LADKIRSTNRSTGFCFSDVTAGMGRKLGQGGDFHLTVFQARLIHHLFQTAGRRIINPLFAVLGANRGLHAPHYHYSAPQIRCERGFPTRFVPAA
jgi:hypothetical protein